MHPKLLVFASLFLTAACGSSSSTTEPTMGEGATGEHTAAQTEELVRCRVTVEFEGEPMGFFGWGKDEAEAQRHSELAAVVYRDHNIRTRYWFSILSMVADPDRDMGTLVSMLFDPPSATQSPAECQSVTAPEAARVRVRWAVGAFHAESQSPAIAIETARRVACQSQWSQSVAELFRAMATMEVSTRAGLIANREGEIIAELSSCMTSQDYVVEQAEHPSVRSPPRASLCQVALSVDRDAQFVGQGVGSDQTRALFAASTRAVQVAFARSDQLISDAINRGDPAMRSMLLSQGISNGISAAAFESLAGLALARCAPAAESLATWMPRSQTCAPPPGPEVPESLCGGVRDRAMGQVRDAVSSAAPDVQSQMVVAAWAEVQGCEADCVGEFEIANVGSFSDTHRSHCGTEAAARATMQRGIDRRNVKELLHCANPEMTAMIVSQFLQDPERIWTAMTRLDVAVHTNSSNSAGAVRLGFDESFR